MQIRRIIRPIAGIAILAAISATGIPAYGETHELAGNIILSVSRDTVRWAAILRKPDPASGDLWYHIEVIEKDRRTQPWLFRRLVNHMAISAEALQMSRVPGRAKMFAYKDVEFRYAYREWLNQPLPDRERSVCRTNVLECLQPSGGGDRDGQ